MPVTPSLTQKGILLLVEYRKKLNEIKNNSFQKEVHPQYLAADNILKIFIQAASGILWPFIQNLLANKKELDKNFFVLTKNITKNNETRIINITDAASLVLSELIFELLTEVKNNTNLYIDPGTALNTIGPLVSSLIGEEIKIENKEQAFAFMQYHLITTIIEIKKEIDNYKFNFNYKNNIEKILIPNIISKKYLQENISIEMPKIINNENIYFKQNPLDQLDKECHQEGEKKGKDRQISNLLDLLDQLTCPSFLRAWPLDIPEELLQVISLPHQQLYMAITFEQKQKLIKRIITDIYLFSKKSHKIQIKEKIKLIKKSESKFIINKLKDHHASCTLSNSTYEVKSRYINLLKKNPGIYPVRLAIDGLMSALTTCRYKHELDDIIESLAIIIETLKTSHLNSQMLLKALHYELLFSLKKPASLTLPMTLVVPDSKRYHTISCLNILLNICHEPIETYRVYYIASSALDKINGHLKNKIIYIINNINNNINILKPNFSIFEDIVNNNIILLLKYIIYHEKNNFLFFNLFTNQFYYYNIIDFAKQLIIKLFLCKNSEDLTYVQDEISQIKTVLMVNENSHPELVNTLKKIQISLIKISQEDIKAAYTSQKKC